MRTSIRYLSRKGCLEGNLQLKLEKKKNSISYLNFYLMKLEKELVKFQVGIRKEIRMSRHQCIKWTDNSENQRSQELIQTDQNKEHKSGIK